MSCAKSLTIATLCLGLATFVTPCRAASPASNDLEGMMRRSQNYSSQSYASDNNTQFASDDASQSAAPTPGTARANLASYELPPNDSSLCDQQEPALLSSPRTANRQMQSVRQASASSAYDPYNVNGYPTSQQALQQQTYQPRSNQSAQLPQPQPLSSNPMNGWAGDVTMRTYLQNNQQARMQTASQQNAQAYGPTSQNNAQSTPAAKTHAVEVSQNTARDNTPREVPDAVQVAAESSSSDHGSCSQCNGSCSQCSSDHCGCSDTDHGCSCDHCDCDHCCGNDDDQCCCDDCCWTPCGCPGWFAGADYLYVRPDFSSSPAFVRITGDSPATLTYTTIQQKFDYNSSVRAFFGYRTDCNEEIRFTYWHFNDGGSQTVTGDQTDVAYGGQFMTRANEPGDTLTNTVGLEMNVYDIDYIKCCCNPCGCQSPCCPVWTLSYSAGVRVASMRRTDNTIQNLATPTAEPTAGFISASFIGAGPRLGLEGHRYFRGTRASLFARGNFSLMLGEYDSSQNVLVTTPDRAVTRLVDNKDRIIPEADIEIGADWQICCHWKIAAGYMLQAWWDLGEFEFVGISGAGFVQPLNNSNILGFDGGFARIEYNF